VSYVWIKDTLSEEDKGLIKAAQVTATILKTEGNLQEAAELIYPEDKQRLALQKLKNDLSSKPLIARMVWEKLEEAGFGQTELAERMAHLLNRTEKKWVDFYPLVLDENGWVTYTDTIIDNERVLEPLRADKPSKREIEMPLDKSRIEMLKLLIQNFLHEPPTTSEQTINVNHERDSLSELFDKNPELDKAYKQMMLQQGIERARQGAVEAEIVE